MLQMQARGALMSAALKSKREDGRGHWPAGKSRSTLTAADRARVIRKLRKAALDLESVRAVSRTLEVADSSIRRILSGEDQPSERIRDLVDARL
jgi:hypothetical protein